MKIPIVDGSIPWYSNDISIAIVDAPVTFAIARHSAARATRGMQALFAPRRGITKAAPAMQTAMINMCFNTIKNKNHNRSKETMK